MHVLIFSYLCPTRKMTVYLMLCFTSVILTSISTVRVISCGVFEFQSTNCINNTVIVNENSTVNITFALLKLNCSKLSFGAIDISKKDLMANLFGRQCSVYEKCKIGPHYNNKSCQCLDKIGLYSFSFIAKREDSTFWRWSTTNPIAKDSILEIIVIYPSRVIDLEIIGYDRHVPRHKSVSIFCLWENGNPPSEVKLLDRYGNVLASEKISANFTYTFHSVDCKHSGTIRCEANGSANNESVTMLVECPPEIIIPEPKIRIIYSQQNASITFPLRSHDTQITTCHITRLNRNKNLDTASSKITASFSCTNLSAHFTSKRKYCIYLVTGIPPDLQLTLQVYNVQTEDVGLWYVNVSNNKGSDGMYIQVDESDEENHLLISDNVRTSPVYVRSWNAKTITHHDLHLPEIIGIVLGIIAFMVIVFIAVYCFKNGKDTYYKLRRREIKAMPAYRVVEVGLRHGTFHSHRDSRIYHEIADYSEVDGKNSAESCVTSQTHLPQLIQNQTASIDTTDTGYLQPGKSDTMPSSGTTRYTNIPTNVTQSSTSNSINDLLANKTEIEVDTVPEISNDLGNFPPINEANNTPVIPNDLGDFPKEANNTPEISNDLGNFAAIKKANNTSVIPNDLGDFPKIKEANNIPVIPNDLGDFPKIKEVNNTPVIPNDLGDFPKIKEANNTSLLSNDVGDFPREKDMNDTPVLPNDLGHILTKSDAFKIVEFSVDLTSRNESHRLDNASSIESGNDDVNQEDTSYYLTPISEVNGQRDVKNSDYLPPVQRN